MKLIVTANQEPTGFTNVWREKCSVEFVALDRLMPHLQTSAHTGLTSDAIVEVASLKFPRLSDDFLDDRDFLAGYNPLEPIINFVRELRELDSVHAMADGRKWCALPFVLILSGAFAESSIPQSLDITTIVEPHRPQDALAKIEDIYRRYRNRLLDELDNLGILVTYEHGRYRVGPALATNKKNRESRLYYAAADRRDKAKYYTIDRDNVGIQYEVELFEALINDPKISETRLQQFFEDHPHFLLATRLLQSLPHVPLRDSQGKLFVPDFVLKPIVAARRDSNWEVLDLKLPQAKLLAGPRDHKRFSRDVAQAIAQVKDYRDYFENPENSAAVQNALGHRLRHPKLGIVIGRLPSSEAELETLERQQSREPGVRVVTYDEILETQKNLVS